VITIRGIGETQPKQDGDFGNSVTLDLDPQQNDEFQTRRAFVNIQPSARDRALWDAMDKASDDAAKVFANGHNIDVIKNGTVIRANVDPSTLPTVLPYKFSDATGVGRRDGLGATHHEAGTMRMGDDPNQSVTDANCRFHNVANAYVAGPSLFPTIGSPNPMLTGIALVRRLGDFLLPDPPLPTSGSGVHLPVRRQRRAVRQLADGWRRQLRPVWPDLDRPTGREGARIVVLQSATL
jgi:choline dehydrogenase-like flavoprotein